MVLVRACIGDSSLSLLLLLLLSLVDDDSTINLLLLMHVLIEQTLCAYLVFIRPENE